MATGQFAERVDDAETAASGLSSERPLNSDFECLTPTIPAHSIAGNSVTPRNLFRPIEKTSMIHAHRAWINDGTEASPVLRGGRGFGQHLFGCAPAECNPAGVIPADPGSRARHGCPVV